MKAPRPSEHGQSVATARLIEQLRSAADMPQPWYPSRIMIAAQLMREAADALEEATP